MLVKGVPASTRMTKSVACVLERLTNMISFWTGNERTGELFVVSIRNFFWRNCGNNIQSSGYICLKDHVNNVLPLRFAFACQNVFMYFDLQYKSVKRRPHINFFVCLLNDIRHHITYFMQFNKMSVRLVFAPNDIFHIFPMDSCNRCTHILQVCFIGTGAIVWYDWPNASKATLSNMDTYNSSPPSAAYMRQWIGPSLVQVLACRLFGAKPLPEPMLAYWQLDSWEQISVKFESEFYHFHSRKCTWKCRLPKWWPFCPGGNGLMHSHSRT